METLQVTANQHFRCECVRRQSSVHRPFRRATTSERWSKLSAVLQHKSVQNGVRQQRRRDVTSPLAALKQPSDPAAAHDYFATDKRPVVLFDGVCNLCNGAVDFLLDWDKQAKYRLAALQSKAGRDLLQQAGRHPDDLSSIVLVEPGQAYIKSEAVLRIGQRLNTPFYALGSMGLPVPSLIRDSVYDMVRPVAFAAMQANCMPRDDDVLMQVAENRYKVFGKTNSCRKCAQGFDERFIAD